MKFRAWDIASRTMLSWENIMDMSARRLFGEHTASEPYETESSETKEFEVMCYTGKRDISEQKCMKEILSKMPAAENYRLNTENTGLTAR